jgi:DNA-binding HxlR family transcriptional regulator
LEETGVPQTYLVPAALKIVLILRGIGTGTQSDILRQADQRFQELSSAAVSTALCNLKKSKLIKSGPVARVPKRGRPSFNYSLTAKGLKAADKACKQIKSLGI